MLKAIITIKINHFRPLGSVFPISASMSMPPTEGIIFDGESIIITKPGPAQLTFKIPNRKFILLGVSFVANKRKPDPGVGEFPLVTITRSAKTGSNLTVLDENKSTTPFDYLLLVQSAADGSIGVIDPFIRYEPK